MLYILLAGVYRASIIILLIHFAVQKFRLHAYILVPWPCLLSKSFKEHSLSSLHWFLLTGEQLSLPCQCLVIHFYDTELHKNLKFTACLNRVCWVRSTIPTSFSSVSFGHRPAIYKQCCQVTNFLAKGHLSKLILPDSVFTHILHA